MSRKRQHQPTQRREERVQTENMSDGEKTGTNEIIQNHRKHTRSMFYGSVNDC